MITTQIERILNLFGGIDDSSSSRNPIVNTVSDLRNIDFHRQGDQLVMSKAKGYKKYKTAPVEDVVTGVFKFIKETDGTRRNMVCVGDRIYVVDGMNLKYVTSPGRGWLYTSYEDASYNTPVEKYIVPFPYQRAFLEGNTYGASATTVASAQLYQGNYDVEVEGEDLTLFVRSEFSGSIAAQISSSSAYTSSDGGMHSFAFADLTEGVHWIRISKTSNGELVVTRNNQWDLLDTRWMVPPNYTEVKRPFSAVAYLDRLYMQNGSEGKIVWFDGTHNGFLANSPNGVKYIAEHANHLFTAGIKNDENSIQSSALGDVETWTGADSFGQSFDQRVTGFGKLPLYLVIFLEDSTHFLAGTNASEFEVVKTSSTNGCVSHFGIVSDGTTLFYPAKDGFWRLTGLNSPDKISDPYVDRLFKSIVSSQWESIVGIEDLDNSRCLWACPINGSAKNNAVLVYYYNEGTWTVLDWEVAYFGKFRNSIGKDEILFGDYEGNVHLVGVGFNKDSLPMKSYLRTHPISLGSYGSKKSVWACDVFYKVRGDHKMKLRYKSDLSDWRDKEFNLYDENRDYRLGKNFRIDSSKLSGKDNIRRKRIYLNIPAKEIILQLEHETLDEDFQFYGLDIHFQSQGEGSNG